MATEDHMVDRLNSIVFTLHDGLVKGEAAESVLSTFVGITCLERLFSLERVIQGVTVPKLELPLTRATGQPPLSPIWGKTHPATLGNNPELPPYISVVKNNDKYVVTVLCATTQAGCTFKGTEKGITKKDIAKLYTHPMLTRIPKFLNLNTWPDDPEDYSPTGSVGANSLHNNWQNYLINPKPLEATALHTWANYMAEFKKDTDFYTDRTEKYANEFKLGLKLDYIPQKKEKSKDGTFYVSIVAQFTLYPEEAIYLFDTETPRLEAVLFWANLAIFDLPDGAQEVPVFTFPIYKNNKLMADEVELTPLKTAVLVEDLEGHLRYLPKAIFYDQYFEYLKQGDRPYLSVTPKEVKLLKHMPSAYTFPLGVFIHENGYHVYTGTSAIDLTLAKTIRPDEYHALKLTPWEHIPTMTSMFTRATEEGISGSVFDTSIVDKFRRFFNENGTPRGGLAKEYDPEFLALARQYNTFLIANSTSMDLCSGDNIRLKYTELSSSLIQVLETRFITRDTSNTGVLTDAGQFWVQNWAYLEKLCEHWDFWRVLNRSVSVTQVILGTIKMIRDLVVSETTNLDLKVLWKREHARLKTDTPEGTVEDAKKLVFPLVWNRAVQPHQLDNILAANNNPAVQDNAIDAGGGKTILGVLSILAKLGAGKIKLPVAVVPGHLVQVWVNEVAYVSHGKMNAIPITTDILNRWGEDEIEKLVNRLKHKKSYMLLVVPFSTLNLRPTEYYLGDTLFKQPAMLSLLYRLGVDALYIDESHYAKTKTAQRTRNILKLGTMVKYVTRLSGTIVTDSLQDIASQMAISMRLPMCASKAFTAMYGDDLAGGKVLSWKEGAGSALRKNIALWSQYHHVRKYMWARSLPDVTETMHFCTQLSPQHWEIYDALIQSTLEQIRTDDPKLYDQLLLGSNEDWIFSALGFYLARVERFLSAPYLDDLGKNLGAKDLYSPKGRTVLKIVKQHLKAKIPGKVIVVSNNVASAKAIFEELHKNRLKVILYTAATKDTILPKFEEEDYDIMVGVGISLREGLNLQFCSRFISCEVVWNPGMLEQQTKRIDRPDLKSVDKRKRIYLDTVIADQTVDVSKMLRLISKLLNKAKFDEPNNVKYQKLPNLPMLSLTADTILHQPSYDSEVVQEYVDALSSWRKLEFGQMEYWRKHETRPILMPLGDSKVRDNFVPAHRPLVPRQSFGKLWINMSRIPVSEYKKYLGKKVRTEYGKGTLNKVLKSGAKVTTKSNGVVKVKYDLIWAYKGA